MGYFLENEDGIDPLTLVICAPKTAMDSMRASENLRKSSYVEEARKQAGTFTKALDYILGSPMTWAQAEDGRQVLVHSLPPYITSFYEMINPRLEKQDGDWIWISYESGYNPGIRVTGQYRNAYDLSMLDLDD